MGRIFTDTTEASNGKKTKASDWSNLRFHELPPFSNTVDVNMNSEMINNMTECVFLVNYRFREITR